jgi:hypothetical protein
MGKLFRLALKIPSANTRARSFLDELMSFMGIGFALYIIANVYGMMSKESIIKNVVKCPYCKKAVSGEVRAQGPTAMHRNVEVN